MTRNKDLVKSVIASCWMLSICSLSFAAAGTDSLSVCPEVRIDVQRLPDMQVPRQGHSTIYINGETVVIGGHTTGFIPSATAEYFSNGTWHQITTIYNHDSGVYIPLSSGKVMVGGGYETHLGIGQTYVVEVYDPVSHSFNVFNGILSIKRAIAAGAELANGNVVIAGNWYNDDGIELLEDGVFKLVKPTSLQRTNPYIFPTSDNDAVILSGKDIHGNPLNSAVVDCLKGDPFEVPLLEEWQPLEAFIFTNDICFMGDKSQGVYAYLMPVKNQSGQIAVVQVVDKDFTILPTASPIPTSSKWGDINYIGPVVVDRHAGKAYLQGHSVESHRFYVLSIDYAHYDGGKGAPITLYYTDPMPELGINLPVLTPEGNLLVAGGITISNGSNFTPTNATYMFMLNSPHAEATFPVWWIVGGCLLFLVSLLVFMRYRKLPTAQEVDDSPSKTILSANEALMNRITELMENKKPYLNSDLKVSDIATALGISSRNVSDCIKLMNGTSFSQYINGYRVEYIKQLLREKPGVKMTEIYIESGFANETSFFRTFKAFEGMTPKEWISQNN